MPTPKLTPEIIIAAIVGFEQQKLHIDAQIAELRAMLPGGPATSAATPEPTKRKRRKMSAAGRKAISPTKKRWAAVHAAQQASEQPTSKKAARKSAKKTARKKAAVKKAVTKKVVKNSAAKKAAKKTATTPTPTAATTA